MAKIVGRGGYLGTNSNSWRVVANGVFDGIWFSNEQVTVAELNDGGSGLPGWCLPGDIPSQGEAGGHVVQGPASGSITVGTNCPHAFLFIASGGGGGGVDHDNGQARPGGSAQYAFVDVTNHGFSTGGSVNYSIGGGGTGAPARSNDGNGSGGGASQLTVGNFTFGGNAGAGGCGKCPSGGSSGTNFNPSGTGVFSGQNGGATTYATGFDNNFTPIVNIPVTATPVPTNNSNGGGGSNGGSQGGQGAPGRCYVRFGRGINPVSAGDPGPGDDYGVPNPVYRVPIPAKMHTN